MVDSHCSLIVHIGKLATESALRENFIWLAMTKDLHEFVKICIYCLTTRSVETLPRPLGWQIHSENTNEVLQTNFLYIGTISYEPKLY